MPINNTGVGMKILMNKKYFVVLPKAAKPARDELVRLYKIAHPELKHAQVVVRDAKWNHIGVLTERTV